MPLRSLYNSKIWLWKLVLNQREQNNKVNYFNLCHRLETVLGTDTDVDATMFTAVNHDTLKEGTTQLLS